MRDRADCAATSAIPVSVSAATPAPRLAPSCWSALRDSQPSPSSGRGRRLASLGAIVRVSCLCFALSVAASPSYAEEGPLERHELEAPFASLDRVRELLEPALTPEGKFVLLPDKGSVLVIDRPRGIAAAEAALAQADFPQAQVDLEFQFRTGLPTRGTSITVGQEVPLPVEWSRPRLIVGPSGVEGWVPPSPTRFETRQFGTTSESRLHENPDGSVTVELRSETSQLDGFIRYGGTSLRSGGVATIPVSAGVPRPGYFARFVDPGSIAVPIVSTTRVSTVLVVRPRFARGLVELDLMPRLRLEPEPDSDSPREAEEIDLRDFQTTLPIRSGSVGRLNRFEGSEEDFLARFLGVEDPEAEGADILIRAAAAKAIEETDETEEVKEPDKN